jgi:flavin-dependent dehydrogenase
VQVRSEFDEIVLRHAAESGATVCEGVQVTGINFSRDDPKQPVSADWKSDLGSKGEVRFKFLVDASGRNGIMSTKYLKNRKFNQALKNIAFWGYWTGAGMYEPGTRRENAPWFEALTGKQSAPELGVFLI